MTEGIVTLITGTRTGIGRFLAEHYLDHGHYVVGCSRSTSDLKSSRYQHFVLDVSDEAAVVSMVAEIEQSLGRIDNLVNNAGIASMNHALLMPGSTVERILRTNVTGLFLCCREAAKVMMRLSYGRIVNFSTVATPLQLEGEAAYAASKAAVVSLTQTLAREFGNYGITVNAIGPTPIDTDLIRGVEGTKIERLIDRQAVKRKGTFEDVTNVTDFFLRRESGFVTGQCIYLGGVS
jgi:3-oxoacyl-[acyl-carrier protein] reductase